MLSIYLTITMLFHDASTNMKKKIRDDRGSVTLEQVIITAGIVTVALLAIAAITAAVNTRLGQIR